MKLPTMIECDEINKMFSLGKVNISIINTYNTYREYFIPCITHKKELYLYWIIVCGDNINQIESYFVLNDMNLIKISTQHSYGKEIYLERRRIKREYDFYKMYPQLKKKSK